MTKLVSSENLTSFGQQFLSHLSTVATTGSFYDLTDVPEEYAQEYQAFNLYTRTSSSDTAPSLPATTDWKWYTAENKIASAADSSISVVGIWSSVVPQPTGTNIYLWSTSGSFRSGDGTMTSAWQPAYCMTGAKGETGEQGGKGDTGEKGEKGDSGNFVSICFTRTNLDLTAQENAAYLPTGGTYSSPIPTTTVSGTTVWSDGIPTGDASLWMTKCTFSTDTTTPVWSTPSKATDTADVDFEYSSLATPGNPNNASSLATDWHDGSEATAADIWMAMRTYKNGVWTEFVVFKIKGEDGKDGETGPAGTDGVDGAFTAICFTRTNLDLTDSLNAQYLPTGGSYVSPIPTTLVDGNFVWSDGIPSGESILWMTTCTIHPSDETLNWSAPKQATDTATLDFEYSSLDEPRDPNNATYLNADWHNTPTALDIWMALRVCKNGEWSQFSVFKIKGEDGTDGINGQDGQDGEFDKFIYKLCNSQTEFDNLTTPTGTAPEFDDTVWSDNALSLTAAGQIVAYSYSHKDSNGWSAWSTPKVWSAWGNNGTDGDGVQYIYYVTGSSSLANNQMPSNLAASIVSSSQYQTKNAEFIPTTGMALEGGGTLACTWTDNPTGVSETTQYEYVSVRRYVNGTWSAFSVPKLWAYHATDGVDGIVTNYTIVPRSNNVTKTLDGQDYIPKGTFSFVLMENGVAQTVTYGSRVLAYIGSYVDGDALTNATRSSSVYTVKINESGSNNNVVSTWDDDKQFIQIIWKDASDKIIASYIIPMIVPGEKGADGQDGQDGQDGSSQSLTGIVLRVSNWSSTGNYNDGTVAEDGVYYQDVVYYDGRYYKCVSTNYSTTPDVDPAFESFSIASDAAFNTILANSAYVKGLTTQQVVLTDNNNTIVGGMTSSSAIPNSDIDSYTIGDVRIWAGTPTTTGDLTTTPFNVTNTGELTITHGDNKVTMDSDGIVITDEIDTGSGVNPATFRISLGSNLQNAVASLATDSSDPNAKDALLVSGNAKFVAGTLKIYSMQLLGDDGNYYKIKVDSSGQLYTTQA